MISRKELIREIKRYPDFIRQAVDARDYVKAHTLQVELDTMVFIAEYEEKDWK